MLLQRLSRYAMWSSIKRATGIGWFGMAGLMTLYSLVLPKGKGRRLREQIAYRTVVGTTFKRK